MQDERFRARPRLDIIQPLPESCEEISSDALTVRNFQDNECRDYRLGETIKTAFGEMSCSPFTALLFHYASTYQMSAAVHNIQSHKCIFINRAFRGRVPLLHHQSQRHRRGQGARPRWPHRLAAWKEEIWGLCWGLQTFQKVAVYNYSVLSVCAVTMVWLWQEALMAAEISFKNIKRHDVQKIGMAYINHLLEKGDYDSAARYVWHPQVYSALILSITLCVKYLIFFFFF